MRCRTRRSTRLPRRTRIRVSPSVAKRNEGVTHGGGSMPPPALSHGDGDERDPLPYLWRVGQRSRDGVSSHGVRGDRAGAAAEHALPVHANDRVRTAFRVHVVAAFDGMTKAAP